ncbi:hypothetical protein [Actinomycetospora soli]|uniref:hypothetical protein n=1 Tax=Actinomycetospora soli TaxID=2893887 RepID=UPI001E2A45C7|nr:hypothetical protein [Actinomycetospora soli]MCD2188713.1 hypothetical protein [Actinomycetospora soli]
MRVGRGTRAAAVLMAGLVGAAVIAPGVAFAQATTQAACVAENGTWDGTTCTPASAPDSTGDGGSSTTGTPSDATVELTPSTLPSVPATPDSPTSDVPDTSTTTTPESADATENAEAQEQAADDAAAKDAADAVAAQQVAASAVSPAEVTDSLRNLTGLDLVSGLPIADALEDLPTGNLDLGDLEIPEFPLVRLLLEPAGRLSVPGQQGHRRRRDQGRGRPAVRLVLRRPAGLVRPVDRLRQPPGPRRRGRPALPPPQGHAPPSPPGCLVLA